MDTRHNDVDRRTLLTLLGSTGIASSLITGSARRTHASISSATQQTGIVPFEIRVVDDDLDDLRRRLTRTRWPEDSPGEPRTYGTDRAFLEELIAYWRNEYDWQTHEAALNTFNHYTTTVAGQHLHFVHQRSQNPSAMPLLMTHGWPGTIWEMLPSVRALSNPSAEKGQTNDAFHVVVPSIPGFGFSGEPAEGTDIARTAELWVELMDTLGYEQFGAYGSDWGAGVTRELGARFPDRVVGIHTPGAPPENSAPPQPRRSETTLTAQNCGRSTKLATSGYRAQNHRPLPTD